MGRVGSWIIVAASGLALSCAQGEGGDDAFGASLLPGSATDGDETETAGSVSTTDEGGGGSDTDADEGSGGDETGAPETCGNGALDAGEACDGSELDGQDCESQGAGTGALACASNCLAFDTTGCSAGACGNGTLDAGEVCDGDNLDGSTCATEGFDGGTLACAKDCGGWDTSGCGTCGNAVVEGDEACDGAPAQSCTTEGFDSGTLACDAACGLDTSGCGTCGNAVVDGDEECDGVAPQDCAGLGLGVGPVACTSCVTDTSGCVSAPEEVDFPTAADTVMTASGGPPWTDGDFYQGDRDTGIPSFDTVDIHIEIEENSLTACGVQTAQVSLNGTAVGSFSVTQGDTAIDASFPVAPSIVGPSYTIRYETTATVGSGCGSAGYATSGSTVTLFPG